MVGNAKKTLRVSTIIGARPQFIKAATVSRVIQELNLSEGRKCVEESIIHTGQHYDKNMSDIFFEELNIPKPQKNLGIGNLSHGAMTGLMLEKIESFLLQNKTDIVLVYGDTNSTLAGALAAVKLGIRVAHIEAGLRCGNKYMAEEINRIVTDRISDFCYCPTQVAYQNLKSEGLSKQAVLVGDVMYDSALFFAKQAKNSTVIDQIGLCGKRFVLSTIHRAENVDNHQKMLEILTGLSKIAKEIPVILPVHPRAKSKVEECVRKEALDNIHLIKPLPYLDFTKLILCADGVITDSGGLQKEAFFYKRPCVTIREETEWIETVELGSNILVGADRDKIYNSWLNCKFVDANVFPYGKGDAAQKIIGNLVELNLNN